MDLCVQFIFTFLLLVCRVESQNFKFAFELYKNVADETPTTNVVMSPLSVETALGLLLMGADGNTRDQISKGLGYFPSDYYTIEHFFQRIHNHYKMGNALIIANKIYTKVGYPLQTRFENQARSVFNSETDSINFANSVKAADTINYWVARRTGDKIPYLFRPDQLDAATRMVLANAVYFKGLWKRPFNVRATQRRPFWVGQTQSVMTDMMFSHMEIEYGDIVELDAQVGRIPYQNSDLSMMIILPNERTGLLTLENKLSTYNISKLASIIRPRMVDVSLPKFQLESTIDLKYVLKKLGIVDLFSENANLSKMLATTERLTVDTAVHKVFIQVDEEGTIAAGATGFGIIALSASPIFTCDHPFLFAIVGPQSVLSIGSFRRPYTIGS